MKNLSVNECVKIIETCIPKIIKGMKFMLPKHAMGIKLSFSQCLALIRLGYHDSCKMTELSGETGINLTALTGVIDSLIKEKFVKRRRDPKDRRVVQVELTPRGRKLVNEIRQYRRKSVKFVIESLSMNERETIIKGFEKMVNIFYEQSTKEK